MKKQCEMWKGHDHLDAVVEKAGEQPLDGEPVAAFVARVGMDEADVLNEHLSPELLERLDAALA